MESKELTGLIDDQGYEVD